MEMKWKIYYACNLYLVVWSLAMVGVIMYGIIAAHLSGNNAIVIPGALSVLLIVFTNSLISFHFVALYKKGGMSSKIGRLFFYIFYGFVVILTISSSILLATELPQSIKRAQSNGGIETLLEAGLTLATLTGIYFCIMAPSLITAIRKNHQTSIDTIGQQLHP